MRRWTVTLGLTATAVTAAILAPRLMPQRDCQLPVHVVEAQPDPVQPETVQALLDEVPELPPPPPRPNAIRVDGGAAGVVTFDTIPEAQARPTERPTVLPVAPAPLPDDFWQDAVDCGMG